VRRQRGWGIVMSSEARDALSVRGPYDVINLAQIWGLGQERGKEALCEEAERVVRLAGLKRTSFRGVVDVIQGGGRVGIPGAGAGAGAGATAVQKKGAVQQQAGSGDVGQPVIAARSEVVLSNGAGAGAKRKASTASFTGPAVGGTQVTEEKPLSKREIKRRAKKARLEGRAGPDGTETSVQDTTASSFPIKHEALEGDGAPKS